MTAEIVAPEEVLTETTEAPTVVHETPAPQSPRLVDLLTKRRLMVCGSRVLVFRGTGVVPDFSMAIDSLVDNQASDLARHLVDVALAAQREWPSLDELRQLEAKLDGMEQEGMQWKGVAERLQALLDASEKEKRDNLALYLNLRNAFVEIGVPATIAAGDVRQQGIQIVREMEARITDLESELTEVRSDRDQWERNYNDIKAELESELVAAVEMHDEKSELLRSIRAILHGDEEMALGDVPSAVQDLSEAFDYWKGLAQSRDNRITELLERVVELGKVNQETYNLNIHLIGRVEYAESRQYNLGYAISVVCAGLLLLLMFLPPAIAPFVWCVALMVAALAGIAIAATSSTTKRPAKQTAEDLTQAEFEDSMTYDAGLPIGIGGDK